MTGKKASKNALLRIFFVWALSLDWKNTSLQGSKSSSLWLLNTLDNEVRGLKVCFLGDYAPVTKTAKREKMTSKKSFRASAARNVTVALQSPKFPLIRDILAI